MQYTTTSLIQAPELPLYYQDFKDTFVCNTQHEDSVVIVRVSCIIRISKILLYAIHNMLNRTENDSKLYYQDFNENLLQKYRKNRKYANLYVISEKSTTFAATKLKDIHNKDYSVV